MASKLILGRLLVYWTGHTHVQSFLGLVQYLADHLPDLAKFTSVLNPLTTKAAEHCFPSWSASHQLAFDGIKRLVTSPVCLTTIDHDNPGDNHIFLTTDASDYRMGAVLSWGPDWKSTWPVTFNSSPLRGAELNYPVHEKELLAIIRGLKKWCIKLLGNPVLVYTDHRTLQNFHTQYHLSRRQARWSECMSQFDLEIWYIKGDDNDAADALSCRRDDDAVASVHVFNIASALTDHSFDRVDAGRVTAVVNSSTIEHDQSFLLEILAGYTEDNYCRKLFSLLGSVPGLTEQDGLLYLAGRLVIPHIASLHAHLFHLAHDASGHFGADKTYAS